ncbi:MAG: hypothetical protein GFH27_549283n261 [Chloroflexi bacterium AL-W]|nr:hypothetical protein [Chloroflexi bacterium AL-N1]NOK64619.1 hypothetical protein [Chloroflexi bacterium AL-N10]NOK75860.1 hypothetical protein [Chloroflexi bacterium AL-N5]NOK80382.1 hypothetical protein [Chloroflexi bacterium AL-W]NOK86895.1 hypothetical protein [Chloroflexi bacterium AL-N15]
MSTIISQTNTSDDEIAAALAAVRCYIQETTEGSYVEGSSEHAWRAAAKLEAQGHSIIRNGAHSSWATAERTWRLRNWSRGIVGS